MNRNIIEEMKRKNGNESFTQKDLTWYMLHQLENINTKLDNKVSKTTFWKITGIIFLAIGAIIFGGTIL